MHAARSTTSSTGRLGDDVIHICLDEEIDLLAILSDEAHRLLLGRRLNSHGELLLFHIKAPLWDLGVGIERQDTLGGRIHDHDTLGVDRKDDIHKFFRTGLILCCKEGRAIPLPLLDHAEVLELALSNGEFCEALVLLQDLCRELELERHPTSCVRRSLAEPGQQLLWHKVGEQGHVVLGLALRRWPVVMLQLDGSQRSRV
mmetsp:Transcript_6082/g.19377  ORF Transcript_6082/g.19377 Transcript_6082/m.19377 type:complete len:201 (-) Transcript_6082:1192-1794(-)